MSAFVYPFNVEATPYPATITSLQNQNWLNQPYKQTTQNNSPNDLKSNDIQQKTISTKATYMYDAWIDYSNCIDNDRDGYYSIIRIRWDADTDKTSDYVKVNIYYRDDEGYTGFVGDSDWYTIYGHEGSRYAYEYMDVECVSGRGLFDFRLELVNNSGTQYSGSFGEFGLSDIPMEDASYDSDYWGTLFAFILIIAAIYELIEEISLWYNRLITGPGYVIGLLLLFCVTPCIISCIYAFLKEWRSKKSKEELSVPPTLEVPSAPSSPGEVGSCPNCGYVNLSTAEFCVKCGEKLPR